VRAALMCRGETPKLRAMVGSAVASTVESSCSMKRAQAMMMAVVRKLCGRGGEEGIPQRIPDRGSGSGQVQTRRSVF